MSQSLNLPGLGHGGAPIPLAARVGPLLMSGSMNGIDPETGRTPEALGDEVAQLFRNVAALLASVDADTSRIAKMTFFAPDRSVRPQIDEHWVAAFPDPDARPARHLVVTEIPPVLRLQCEVVAWLG